jgi:hypothetical protein
LRDPTGIRPTGAFVNGYFNFSYSFFASMSTGKSASASFQSAKNPVADALDVSPSSAARQKDDQRVSSEERVAR